MDVRITLSLGGIIVLEYVALDKHLLMDGVATTARRNTHLMDTRFIPEYAAKLAEDRKFCADKASERPISACHGGRHTFSPLRLRTAAV